MPAAEAADRDVRHRPVPYVDFPAQYAEERDDVLRCVDEVFSAGDFIGGKAVDLLEAELAAYCGTREAVALNSGTDALVLAMAAHGIGRGDEVITPPNSFVASTASIVRLGAVPVFADVKPDQNIDPAAVEAAVTPRTKAIMAVHLTGRMADMTALRRIADRYGLLLVEDAAQAIGSSIDGMKAGAAGDIGCFSTHPLKNLNAAGDGGFVTTDDPAIAARIRRLRSHGMLDRDTILEFGSVSRMDTLQAALLRMRLKRLDGVIARRRENAARYQARLDARDVFAPPCQPNEFNSFHTFVVQLDRRDALRAFLADRGVQTAVHYPKPIHLQEAARALGYGPGSMPVTEHQAVRILTLPIHQFLSPGDIDFVCESIAEFFHGAAR